MKKLIVFILAVYGLTSCAQRTANAFNFPVGNKTPKTGEAIATFGEGCFWHTEIVFQSLSGVRDAVSGYAGGTIAHPSYDDVCTGSTGHAECVNVYYDPAVISFEDLVNAFFASHDPTQLNRQGNDEGSQYRSVIFYRNQKEKDIINAVIAKLGNSKKLNGKIVTQILPFSTFYAAEDYHQEYIHNHPGNPYVQNVSIPDFENFRRQFKGKFKS